MFAQRSNSQDTLRGADAIRMSAAVAQQSPTDERGQGNLLISQGLLPAEA